MQFRSIGDARMYLNGSFVKYYRNSDPENILYGYVSGVEEKYRGDDSVYPAWRVGPYPGASRRWLSLDEYTIPPQDLKLGNMIFNDVVVYCQRMPARRASIGVSNNSLITTVFGEQSDQPMQEYPEFNTVTTKPEFISMLKGEYPSIQDALSAQHALPFSRCFSFDPIGILVKRLYYKGDVVGEATNDQIMIYPQFAYVADILARELEAQEVSNEFTISVAD